jgi:diguanylate cyclase (GGDEF)-like protein
MARERIAVYTTNESLIRELSDFIRQESRYLQVLESLPDKLYPDCDILLIDAGSVPLELEQSVIDLRSLHFAAPIQIILLTKDIQHISRKLSMGVDDYILCPLDQLELAARIQTALIRLNVQKNLIEQRESFRFVAGQDEVRIKELNQMVENLEIKKRQIEKIANWDPLTGLASRYYLYHLIDLEIERSIRTESKLSGVMIDLDHFKRINDNFGHICGDEVLSKTAELLLKTLRKYDHAGRFGGEEFFVLLPNSDLETGRKIAERYRKMVQKQMLGCGKHNMNVTISAGVAEFHPGSTRDKWIHACDRAMYAAKHLGRNKVEVDLISAPGSD